MLEHGVSGPVAVGVVVGLEVVEIQHGDRERLHPRPGRQQSPHLCAPAPAVQQPGQRVAAGFVVQRLFGVAAVGGVVDGGHRPLLPVGTWHVGHSHPPPPDGAVRADIAFLQPHPRIADLDRSHHLLHRRMLSKVIGVGELPRGPAAHRRVGSTRAGSPLPVRYDGCLRHTRRMNRLPSEIPRVATTADAATVPGGSMRSIGSTTPRRPGP